jgi:hypothetical protein
MAIRFVFIFSLVLMGSAFTETNFYKIAKLKYPNSVALPLAIEYNKTIPADPPARARIQRNLVPTGRVRITSLSNNDLSFFASGEVELINNKKRMGDIVPSVYTVFFFNLPPDTYFVDEIEGYYSMFQQDKNSDNFRSPGWNELTSTVVTFSKNTAIQFTVETNEHLKLPPQYIAMNELITTPPFFPVFKIEGDGTLKNWTTFNQDIVNWPERLTIELASRSEKTPWLAILTNISAQWKDE